MLALSYVYQLLHSFRYLFARHATWVTFCLVIVGLLGTRHPEGVAAVCRFWQMGEPDYHRLLHFFHGVGWHEFACLFLIAVPLRYLLCF